MPIPNYVGIGAGEEFRNDINNHLSGVSTIAPRLVPLSYAQLPAETDGQLYWCTDCQQATPCQNGGGGALAIGALGLWACSNGGGGANAFPLDSNVSAASHRIENLALDTAAGDALSRSQSSLNSLAAPTAAFSMNSQKMHNLAAGGVAGDAIGFAQSNAQLSHNQPGAYVVSQSTADAGPATSAAITAPSSISNGNALVIIIANPQASESYTPPAGFGQVGNSYSNSSGMIIAAFCKTAASESGNYLISWNNSNYYNIILLNISGTSCNQLDTSSGGNGGGSSSLSSISVASLATAHENDLVVAAAGQNAGSNLAPQIGTQLASPSGSGFAATALANSYGATPAIGFGSNSPGALSAIALAFYPTASITAAP
ncbi:MAG: hypothetical protein ABSG46_15795, partial [Candidatus Binataceae bacterium]